MNRKSLGGLVVINVVLIAVLAILSFTPQSVEAQLGGRRAGDYLMVAGNMQGRDNSAIYIIDLNNSAMMAAAYDHGRRVLSPLGSARDLTNDFAPTATTGKGPPLIAPSAGHRAGPSPRPIPTTTVQEIQP